MYKILRFVSASVLFAFLQQNLSADWIISTVDSSANYVGNYCSLAIDADNCPHIAYYDATAKRPKYAKWNGSSWATETLPVSFTADTSVDAGKYISLAVDTSGNAHISYYAVDNVNSYLIYAKGTPTSGTMTWANTILKSDTAANKTGMYSSIALTSNDSPTITCNSAGTIPVCYVNSGGSTWANTLTNIDGAAASYNSLVIDKSSGLKHVAYLLTVGGNMVLKYSQYSAPAWSLLQLDTIDTALFPFPTPVSITLNSDGYPCVAYAYHYDNATVRYHLKYASANKTNPSAIADWSIVTVDNSNNAGMYAASLAIDAQDNQYIAYFTYDNQACLRLAKHPANSSSWDISTVAAKVGTTVEAFASLKLTKNSPNKSCIAYYDSGKLKYAFDNNVPELSWVQEVGWMDKGAKQSISASDTAVNFGITYLDANRDVPKPGYPKLHITDNASNGEIPGSPFTMVQAVAQPSGSYVNAQKYTYDAVINAPGKYNYWFEAYDAWGSSAASLGSIGVLNITPSGKTTGGTNLNDAHPYPSFANLSNGDKVNFAGVTPNADVKIFTSSGDLIRTLKADPNGVVPAWDGTIEGGGKAASGTYMVHASDSKGNKKAFKILLVR